MKVFGSAVGICLPYSIRKCIYIMYTDFGALLWFSCKAENGGEFSLGMVESV